MFRKWINKVSPVFVMLGLALVYVIIQVIVFEPADNIDLTVSVIGEAGSTSCILMGAFIVQRIRQQQLIYSVMFTGLILLFFGGISDVMDEFYTQPDHFTNIAEDLFQLAGSMLLFVGMYLWAEHNRAMVAKLERLATTDELTGMLNRRAFNNAATAEIRRADRHESPLSVMILDIDHFKKINDTHGHYGGDNVLIEFARQARATIRTEDVIARVGGEEFAVLLPETEISRAHQLAERIRATIEAAGVMHGGAHITITVSIGVAQVDEGEGIAEALQRADTALYCAKKSGRNLVCKSTNGHSI